MATKSDVLERWAKAQASVNDPVVRNALAGGGIDLRGEKANAIYMKRREHAYTSKTGGNGKMYFTTVIMLQDVDVAYVPPKEVKGGEAKKTKTEGRAELVPLTPGAVFHLRAPYVTTVTEFEPNLHLREGQLVVLEGLKIKIIMGKEGKRIAGINIARMLACPPSMLAEVLGALSVDTKYLSATPNPFLTKVRLFVQEKN